jgi:hypothetical protein
VRSDILERWEREFWIRSRPTLKSSTPSPAIPETYIWDAGYLLTFLFFSLFYLTCHDLLAST